MGLSGTIGHLFRVNLREERLRRGLSQAQLAKLVSERYDVLVHSTTIAKLEAGQRDARIEELHAFAELFGMSTDALLGRQAGATDVVWAVSKLTTNAARVVAEVVMLRKRLHGDYEDVAHYAKRERSDGAVAPLVEAYRAAADALEAAQKAILDLATQFPLPGVTLGVKG